MKKKKKNNIIFVHHTSVLCYQNGISIYISADCYIFLESTYNTDSHIKISAGGNNFEK